LRPRSASAERLRKVQDAHISPTVKTAPNRSSAIRSTKRSK
jgi:hypothetical protein